MLSEADMVLLIGDWKTDRGCRMEYEACKEYGITVVEIE